MTIRSDHTAEAAEERHAALVTAYNELTALSRAIRKVADAEPTDTATETREAADFLADLAGTKLADARERERELSEWYEWCYARRAHPLPTCKETI